MQCDTNSFKTATKNMSYDEQLLNKNQENSFFRLYRWQRPGLTYCYNRNLPQDLSHIDHSPRMTGGGIVFHVPGDLVFSIGGPLNHPDFPVKYKDKLCFITDCFQKKLEKQGIFTHKKQLETKGDILYCQDYPNPYELYYKQEKVVAFAMRKKKNHFIVQGIIHTHSTWQYFSDLPKTYHSYFTKGIGKNLMFNDLSGFFRR